MIIADFFNRVLFIFKSIIFVLCHLSHLRLNNGYIKINGRVWCRLCKNSVINIDNGVLQLCSNSFSLNNGRNLLLRMDENSRFIIKGHASFYYGCDIILFKDSEFSIGNSFINSDAKIRCHKSITIGDNCAISHDLTIMDSNAHSLNGDRKTQPIIIKDNVWIGSRVTILSGVTIGDGVVIASGALVNRDVPAHCLVAGVPAKIIKENVDWRV